MMRSELTHRGLLRHVPGRLLLLALFTILHLTSPAQEASARLDTNQYRIGEWIPLYLELTTSEGADVTWPLIGARMEELEVLQRTSLDSVLVDSMITYRQTLTLTVFDSGYYAIPALGFGVEGDTVYSDAMIVMVSSVEIDTSAMEVRPIKGPMDAPVRFREILPYLLAGSAILLIILFAVLYFRNRRRSRGEKPLAPEITIPAHEWARAQLAALKAEGLWQSGAVKEYYTRLSDIMRQYLELRFRQPAMESTTDEIMMRLRITNIGESERSDARSVLLLSDLVKFAKASPAPSEHDLAFEQAERFVNATAEDRPSASGEAENQKQSPHE